MDGNLNLQGNTDINQALKEFEVKQNEQQIQKAPEALKNSDIPKMVQLVMKWSGGAIKEQRQAEYVLLGFVILAIIISGFLMFGGRGGQKAEIKAPAGQRIIYPENTPPRLEKQL
ncbi:MAG: hypothetical protein WC884_02385 [Candidatus Paceibacterota bacterium]